MAGCDDPGEYPCNYVVYDEQGIYRMVPEYTVIQGCKALILNELIIKMTGKSAYSVEYR